MSCGIEAGFPVAGRRSLTIVGILVSFLACSNLPVPASAPAKSATPLGLWDLATTQPSAAEVASAIQVHLVNGLDPVFGVLTREERAELTALYQTGAGSPLWTDATGRPNRQARESLELLNDARAEGLDPADYRHDKIDTLAATLESASPPLPRDLARFDVALSREMLRYLRHVHLGRIDPRTIGFRLKVPAEGHDFATLLRSARADGRIAETVAELRPPIVQYDALRTMLARYRSLAAAAGCRRCTARRVVRRTWRPVSPAGRVRRSAGGPGGSGSAANVRGAGRGRHETVSDPTRP